MLTLHFHSGNFSPPPESLSGGGAARLALYKNYLGDGGGAAAILAKCRLNHYVRQAQNFKLSKVSLRKMYKLLKFLP